jgi:hypothetical protein
MIEPSRHDVTGWDTLVVDLDGFGQARQRATITRSSPQVA